MGTGARPDPKAAEAPPAPEHISQLSFAAGARPPYPIDSTAFWAKLLSTTDVKETRFSSSPACSMTV